MAERTPEVALFSAFVSVLIIAILVAMGVGQ